MKNNFKDSVFKLVGIVSSPKTAAFLGVAVALYELCGAIKNLSKANNSIGFKVPRFKK